MALREVDFLLVGGGLASAAAAETLRAENAAGSILILSAEELAPYQRPVLSKQFLLGTGTEAQLFIHPEGFYRDQAIELQLNARAIAVDPAQQTVTTAGGDRLRYERLLLATGMIPKLLPVPGAALAGVYSLRRKADSDALRQAACNAKRAVVLGGSFLGMEVAVSLIALGLDVTIIERGGTVLPWLQAPNVSEYFRHYAEGLGISVLLYDSAAALHGEDRVRAVETSSGRSLACDLVVVAIGVTPATGFLDGSGIALEQGLIEVDELLRTNVPNVFAAGDVTSFYDPVFARRRHIEHWDNAIKQGRLAARNMLGRRLRYDEVSYFFCDVGDLSFDMLGATLEIDERIGRGALAARSFALFYLKDNVPRALFSLGRPADETRVAEGLIRYRVNLLDVKDKLGDPDFGLDRIPMQTVLVLQGGGALGAFECGVVKALEEERIFPDIVAGVSIGALNGAIIAGNPRHATAALEAFWADLAVVTPSLPFAEASRAAVLTKIMMFGVPKFFTPRWLLPPGDPTELMSSWTSYYDTSPMKALISKYVDFAALRVSPVRLLVGAVDVTTAELEIFDSYVDDLTPDHILASGSLPPGFPWTFVNGKAYWDGGIVSNSPLHFVIDRCGSDGKRAFIVDLFAGRRPLPTNMIEVMARYEEIICSERIRSDLRIREMVVAYRKLIEEILTDVGPAALPKIKQRPQYIQLLGESVPMNITRFVRANQSGEPAWRDYDFSDASIRFNQSDGYALVKKTLGGA
jgi:NADPH-dependent 2,4-dienoyl-CoA reductase/sulfur reductase-like enzyme/predicted acylesterase/phospholipase RssA